MQFFRFIRANRRWLAGGLLLTVFSSMGQTFFISLFASEIRDAFSLSHGQFGGIYMIGTLASAATLIMLGRVVDHYSVARVASLVCVCLAGACLLMAFASSVPALLLAIFMLRLFGQGMMSHTAITAMGRWYSAERGQAVTITSAGHQVGEAILPLLTVMIVALIGWRNAWIASALVLGLFALPAITVLLRVERVPRNPTFAENSDRMALPDEATATTQWTRGDVLRDPLFWCMCAGVLAPSFIGTSFFFHQVYVGELKGWSREWVAASFPVMSLSTVTFGLLSGLLIDRLSAVRLLPFFLLPLGLSVLVLAVFVHPATMFAFMFLMGISYGLSTGIFGAIWPEIYGTKHLGAIRSVTMAAMVFSSALGPGLTGWLIDAGVSFDRQLYYMSGYCFMACVVMFLTSRALVLRGAGAERPAVSGM